MTPEEVEELRRKLRHDQSPEEAIETLRLLSRDEAIPGGARVEMAAALLELRTGRSVQSAMARLRREIGLDKPKKARRDEF